MSAERKKLKEYINDLVDKIGLKMNTIYAEFANKEDKSNKKQGLTSTDSDHYPSVPAVKDGIDQAILTSKGYTDGVALGINTALEGYVQKEQGKQLTEEIFTLAEKQKLATLEGSKFRGTFTSLSDLKTEYPEGEGETWHNNTGGWYADVDIPNEASERYIWDTNDLEWVSGGVGGITAEQVLDLYESNADRNAFTDVEKSKLSNIEAEAQKNVRSDWSETNQTSDSYIRNKPTKVSQFENDSKFVKDIIKVEGIGDLEGGGALNQDREIDLTQETKDDIQKGVTAHGWASLGGVSRTTISLNSSNDLDLVVEPGYYHHTGGSAPLNKPIAGTVAGYLEVVNNGGSNFIRQAWRARESSLEYQRTRSSNGNWSSWVEYITEDNLDSQATSLGFIKSSALPTELSDYMKTADAEEAFAPATGYPDWAQELEDLLNF